MKDGIFHSMTRQPRAKRTRYMVIQSYCDLRPYSKSSLTLNEWKFNLSFSRVSLLFLNSWMTSVIPYYVTTHPPAIQKQH
jgi:hypothetical protein